MKTTNYNYEVSKVLTLSTCHIKEDTALYLGSLPETVICFPKGEHGWFLYAGEYAEDPSVPELRKLFEICKEQGCEWLCLDADGPVRKELETFDW